MLEKIFLSILVPQLVVAGFGTHCCVALLQVNDCVVKPLGKVPTPLVQVKVCVVLVVAGDKVVVAPLTNADGQPKQNQNSKKLENLNAT